MRIYTMSNITAAMMTWRNQKKKKEKKSTNFLVRYGICDCHNLYSFRGNLSTDSSLEFHHSIVLSGELNGKVVPERKRKRRNADPSITSVAEVGQCNYRQYDQPGGSTSIGYIYRQIWITLCTEYSRLSGTLSVFLPIARKQLLPRPNR